MNKLPEYFKYWGKVNSEHPGEPKWHLLVYHCLDVAAVGWLLFDPEKPLGQRLAQRLEVGSYWLRHWITFCLCLHDIGKFATAFQGVVPDLSSTLVPSNPRMPYMERHDTLGFLLWQDVLSSQWEKSGSFNYAANDYELKRIFRNIDPWMEIVTGHHGEPPKRMHIHRQNYFTSADEEAAEQFRKAVEVIFLADFDTTIFADKAFKNRLKLNSWMLAGAVVLADWLGSGRNHESYYRDVMALDEYWKSCALPSAANAIAGANLVHSTVAAFEGIGHLFPFITSPTPLQEWAEKRQLGKSNQLFILEDVTGAGKTEAALVVAHRLMADGLADGIYVALPTMATANAMYARLGKAYRRLFATDAYPSLVLAHGARHLSEEFRRSIRLTGSFSLGQSYAEDEESGEAYCSSWLADSRKKALLSEIGVGTLDQALLAVLPARHQSLRIFGLVRKVLIVDEVHAYDPYMNQLLQTLIEAHARQGGSVILLSATLPRQMREKYVQSFCTGIGVVNPTLSEASLYPLATHFPSLEPLETHVGTRRNVERTVAVIMIKEMKHALSIVKEAVGKGQCVCWVRNTVKDARTAYYLLAKQEWMDKDMLMLFHSRFAMIDRQQIEAATLELFGEKSTTENRKGRVLIATQVVEQSLDLDIDVMISDLAPIDLLIQRAGRLHRHVRNADGDRLRVEGAIDQRGEPCLYVFGPDPTTTPNEKWLKETLPGTQAVYQHIGQLWLTQQRLCPTGTGKFTMPGDARVLIEAVYSEKAQEGIPEALRSLCWNAERTVSGHRGMARLNALKLAKGYTRASAEDSGGWDKETRVPTRIGNDSVDVALARIDGDRLAPYADVPEFAWDLSILKLPKSAWKKAQEKIPGNLQRAIGQLKEDVKLLKWVEALPLTEELLRCYDSRMGWGFDKEEDYESDS